MTHAFGWIPQTPDHRDRDYALEETIFHGHQLPKAADLYPHLPPIWDQGQLGSCTAHGSLRAFLTEAIKQGVSMPMLSRLMQYYDTRAIEGTVGSDSGGMVRDAIKVLATIGCAPESEWPYDIAKFTEKPPAACYTDARQYMSVKYQAIRVGMPGAPMRTAIANGLAICFGFSVPQSFEDGSWDPASDVLPLPGPNEGFVGGHCVAVTGYDFSRTEYPEPFFICDNSWGAGWGDNGRFRLAWDWFDPFRGLASDLWVIQAVQ
ncbi:MAG TPA: C1 family peptidase [Solirubrobacteraceae bacterium]|nr:C1 family peptidase [Solirubrobacteraceae bacterium]